MLISTAVGLTVSYMAERYHYHTQHFSKLTLASAHMKILYSCQQFYFSWPRDVEPGTRRAIEVVRDKQNLSKETDFAIHLSMKN